LCAGLLVNIALLVRHNKTRAAIYNVLAFVAIWLIGGALSFITWTTPFEKPIQVSLVQGNIPQEVKWSPDNLRPTLDRYESLTTPHLDSNIIIWPEGAIPIPKQYAESYLEKIDGIAKEHHTTFITGIPIKQTDGPSYYNGLITLGDGSGLYLKRRLVPFGEFTPLANILHKLLTSLDIPMSDFVPGYSNTGPIIANHVKISAFICYEIAFPEQVNTTYKDINMLLTVSNDAWFGHSVAQAQHLQMGRMRSLEMGRPQLFVSNDGITAIIDANGKILKSLPPFEAAVLTDTVQPREGRTPWQRGGICPLLLIIIGMYVYAVILRKKAKSSP
jgi:apolipoprotein N-acyltransferase